MDWYSPSRAWPDGTAISSGYDTCGVGAEAPSVVLIMTDDVGFGAASTFGGAVETPTFDQLARDGLRYNSFTTTGICSPTRAALLTGRNHNTVNVGNVTDAASGSEG